MQVRVLVADDDASLRRLICDIVRQQGYEPVEAADGQQAIDLFFSGVEPGLVILDVMMPVYDGWEVLKEIRAKSEVPVMMLTALDDEQSEVTGLKHGADDYLAKPVQPRLLLARIKALLRRAPGIPGGDTGFPAGDSNELSFGNFRISQATRSTHLGSETIDLTTAEFDLLWLLASHAGNILSRDDLLQQLRGIGFDGLDRSIDARISRLRRKLGDDPENPTRIKTVRGKGYLFSKHDWQ